MSDASNGTRTGTLRVSGTVAWPSNADVTGHRLTVTFISGLDVGDEDVGVACAMVKRVCVPMYHGIMIAPEHRANHGVPPDAPLDMAGRVLLEHGSIGRMLGFFHPFPACDGGGSGKLERRRAQLRLELTAPSSERFEQALHGPLTSTNVDVVVTSSGPFLRSGDDRDDRRPALREAARSLAQECARLGTKPAQYALSDIVVTTNERAVPVGFISATAPDRLGAFRAYMATYRMALATKRYDAFYAATYVRIS